jgi:ATP-dependent RNA helicase RhlE
MMQRDKGRCRPANSNALEIKFMPQNITDAPVKAGNASGADFANFGLPKTMLVTLARQGLIEPTPIQALSIPLLLDGKDLIGLAQTGTGKTAAFLLPLITHLGFSAAVRAGQPPKALILAPTRELANQISQNVKKLSTDLNIRHIAIFGGVRYDAQIRGLRRGVDIVVATPGRLQDLMERGAFKPSGITHFVLDEADHMLDLGFYSAIKGIASSLPIRRQTMLFSATMPAEIEALGQKFLRDPVRVKAPQSGITADKVTQHVTLLTEGEKRNRLCDILRDQATGQALIFVRTKRRADALAKFLSIRGFTVDALHGDMRQTLRQTVLRNFRSGDLQALIATDVAARGIDVAGLSHVINFDLTDTPEAYVHRIGRTGRAGLGGLALSFCAPDEQHKLAAIISVVGERVELFEADGTQVEGFKASGTLSRQRRRGAKSGCHKLAERRPAGRANGPSRSAAKSDKPARKALHKRMTPIDQVDDPKTSGVPHRKPDYKKSSKTHAKPHRRKQPGKGSKPNSSKNAAPSTQTLFSKPPNFTRRPSFSNSATPQRSGKSAKPNYRDVTAGQPGHVPNAKKLAKRPGQARTKSSGSGTAKSGASRSGASRSRQGGHSRLKRRASS